MKGFKNRMAKQNRTRRLSMMQNSKDDAMISHYVNALNMLDPKPQGTRKLSIYLKKAKEVVEQAEKFKKINFNKCWFCPKINTFIIAVQHRELGLTWYKLDKNSTRYEINPNEFNFSDLCAVGLLKLAIDQLSRRSDQLF